MYLDSILIQKLDKLITSLRISWALELSLDKEQTTYDDSLDGLRLGLRLIRLNN